MRIQWEQAKALYGALFHWQTPLSLWETAENLKKTLGAEALATRDAGGLEIKKILEAWVTGKTLTMAYHGQECLVRLSPVAAMDAQLYRGGKVHSVEVTQALFPGRKRNVFGTPYGGFPPPAPVKPEEMQAYETYRESFFQQAFMQVETRIEHKFQLYKALDYLLVYVDLFDALNPRFGYFALDEFGEECADELQYRLEARFAARWGSKIGHLYLLDDKPTRFFTRLAAAEYAAVLQPA